MSLNPQLGSAPITAGGLPVVNNANLTLPYASGGGGSVPSNLTVSTLTVSQGNTTGINMRYADGTSSIGVSADDGAYFNQIKPSLIVANNFGSVVALGADIVAGGLGLVGTGGAFNTQTAGYISGDGAGGIGISSLTVSSINGVAPGGTSLLSSFSAVPCPQSASTVLMSMPAGIFAYSGLCQGGGATSYLSGNLNVLIDQLSGVNFGAIVDVGSVQPPPAFPAVMTINDGDSGLSTIKLIVANTSGTTAAAFTGAVFKLN